MPPKSDETEEGALVRRVLETPDDDTPRLVFADWLDEHAHLITCGQCGGRGYKTWKDGGGFTGAGECPGCKGAGQVPNGLAYRAEFIRVQCEMARNKAGHVPASEENDRRQDFLEEREGQLYALGGAVLWDEKDLSLQPPTAGFHRGFCTRLALSTDDWHRFHWFIAWRPGWVGDVHNYRAGRRPCWNTCHPVQDVYLLPGLGMGRFFKILDRYDAKVWDGLNLHFEPVETGNAWYPTGPYPLDPPPEPPLH